jgi:hypothetical protein
VLAFALVPMGEDGSNELIAGELIADVLGAMREDLGDDLADDPVPVLDRALRERELVAAGWTIKGEIAVHAGGKGRLASLFAPSRKQRLPREIALAEYVPSIAAQLARLPGWPEPARRALHHRLGLTPARPPVRARPPTQPPPLPARARPPTQPPPIPPRARPPTQPPPIPPRLRPPAQPIPHVRPRPPAEPLPPPSPMEWIRQLIEDHVTPERPPPRVVVPGRSTGVRVPDWMLHLIETEFPDDE